MSTVKYYLLHVILSRNFKYADETEKKNSFRTIKLDKPN